MECINRIGASNDPATLRCGIIAPQRKIKAEVKYSLQSRAL